MSSRDASSRVQHCYCCNRPLTFVSKKAEDETSSPGGKSGVVESWECVNEECITHRMRNLKPPTPPLSK